MSRETPDGRSRLVLPKQENPFARLIEPCPEAQNACWKGHLEPGGRNVDRVRALLRVEVRRDRCC